MPRDQEQKSPALEDELMADNDTPREEAEGESSEQTPEMGASALGLDAELAQQRERALRLQAEMQNLRQRQARELNDERRYGSLPLMRDLLPVLDNIDRAIEAAQKTDEAGSLLQGFQLVRQQLGTVLSQHECHAIVAEGEPFDPNFHEAILEQPSEEHAAGTVLQATQTGYRLHDRVVRPAQVIVSSGSPPNPS